jgi:hypothetical protein
LEVKLRTYTDDALEASAFLAVISVLPLPKTNKKGNLFLSVEKYC